MNDVHTVRPKCKHWTVGCKDSLLLEDISEWAGRNGTIKEVFQHLFRATNITSLLSLLVLLLGTLQPH